MEKTIMTKQPATTFSLTIDQVTTTRIDSYLSDHIDQLSRSKISKLIKNKNILVNGSAIKPSYTPEKDDEIFVTLPKPAQNKLTAEPIPLDIIYEDDCYVAINKPKNLTVHPGAGQQSGTLVNGLLYHINHLSQAGGDNRPGLVHRLDKDTTGVIICAKTDEAHWKLSQQFADRQIYKEYRTLVWGTPKCNAMINKPIGRSRRNRKKYSVSEKGKPAKTEYKILKRWHLFSLLKIILHTGRTHQIRVHMKHCHSPVLGDDKYGNDNGRIKKLNQAQLTTCREILKIATRQLLHAYKIIFQHPFTGETVEIKAPLPPDFQKIITLLDRNINIDNR